MRISDWSSDVCSSDHAGCNDTLEPGEGAAADEENILGVNLDEFLLRIFAAALRCDIRNRSFDDFQQRLLNAFAGNIASDRGAVALARDLIDLVDIDDALLRFFDVAVCGLQKFGDDAFDIFEIIAGLGQRGGVDHAAWHVESASDRAGDTRFAGSRWADQKAVRYFYVHIAALAVETACVRRKVCEYG